MTDELDSPDGPDGDPDGDVDIEDAAAPPMRQATVDADDRPRLDAWVVRLWPDLTRAQVQRWIAEARVTVAAQPQTKAGYRLRYGEAVTVQPPAPVALELVAEDIPLEILFEDAHVIVVNKPAGLVVHPAAGHPRGTLVNALLHHCPDLGAIGGVVRPGIVHRLDKDTSGVMIAAKHEAAHHALVAAFADKTTMRREYIALVAPPPPSLRLTLRTLYGRHPTDRKRFSSKVLRGKTAVTHVAEVARANDVALVRCRLETGRTHQIRVHCADHGFGLVGDSYAARPRTDLVRDVGAHLGRQALHAVLLELDHPIDGRRLAFTAPAPADLLTAWAAMGGAAQAWTAGTQLLASVDPRRPGPV